MKAPALLQRYHRPALYRVNAEVGSSARQRAINGRRSGHVQEFLGSRNGIHGLDADVCESEHATP